MMPNRFHERTDALAPAPSRRHVYIVLGVLCGVVSFVALACGIDRWAPPILSGVHPPESRLQIVSGEIESLELPTTEVGPLRIRVRGERDVFAYRAPRLQQLSRALEVGGEIQLWVDSLEYGRRTPVYDLEVWQVRWNESVISTYEERLRWGRRTAVYFVSGAIVLLAGALAFVLYARLEKPRGDACDRTGGPAEPDREIPRARPPITPAAPSESSRTREDAVVPVSEVATRVDRYEPGDAPILRPVTDVERTQLVMEADLHPLNPDARQRCKVVLALARGQSVAAVADAFDVDVTLVHSTIERFNEAGMEGILPQDRVLSERTQTYLAARPLLDSARQAFVERMTLNQSRVVFILSVVFLTPVVLAFYAYAAGWIPYQWLPEPWDDNAFLALLWLFIGVSAGIPLLAKKLRPRLYRTTSPAEAHYQRAVELVQREDFEGAIREIDETLAQDPDFHAAYYLRGSVHNELDHPTEAIADFDKAIRSKVELASSFYGRALARKNRGELEAAVNDLSRTIETDPTYAVAYYARGVCFRELGRNEQALHDFNEYIALDPDNPHIYLAVAETLFFLNQWDRLHRNADRVIALDPTVAKAYRLRGWASGNQGRWDLAMIDLNKAIELGDVNEEAFFLRGLAATRVGDSAQAAADVESLKSLPESELRNYFVKELREFLLL